LLQAGASAVRRAAQDHRLVVVFDILRCDRLKQPIKRRLVELGAVDRLSKLNFLKEAARLLA
jgi:hypothetical protein